MNYRMTARLIAIVLRFVALFMLPALVISLILGETGAVWGLLITMAVMALLSCLPLPFPPRRRPRRPACRGPRGDRAWKS